VQSSIEKRDWETAAGYVHRHLQREVQLSQLRIEIDNANKSSPLSPKEKLHAFSRRHSTPTELPTSLQTLFPHYSAIERDLSSAERILKDTRLKLKEAIQNEFLASSKALLNGVSNDSDVLSALFRCIRLFPQIGEKEMGASLYADHVANQLSRKCSEAVRSVSQLGAY
jgi:hypothetical protein